MKHVFVLFVALLFAGTVLAQQEQAPVTQKEFAYQDWTLKELTGDGELNLRKAAAGKKLTMVVYFASWCPNWKYDVAFVESLYKKYSANGFQVIGVAEYDPLESTRAHVQRYGLTFPIVYESLTRGDRQQTQHFHYRRAAGDTRNWGSPWYLFIEPANIMTGDTLIKKAHVVNGELIRDDAENFIRGQLGLEKEKAAKTALVRSKAVESCDPAAPVAVTAKP